VGRAGPTQLTGPDSAQKVWADLGPTKSSIFHLGRTWPRQQGWAREGKTNNAGPESAWPGNITLGGNYFPPPLLHAERCSFYMQGKNNESANH